MSMDSYVEQLVKEVVATFSGAMNVRVASETEPVTLDARRLQLIGVIVNEIVTNAMKYAFSGRTSGTIRVRTSERDGPVTLAIEDDGRAEAAAPPIHSGGVVFLRRFANISTTAPISTSTTPIISHSLLPDMKLPNRILSPCKVHTPPTPSIRTAITFRNIRIDCLLSAHEHT